MADSLNFLILDTYYPQFLSSLYDKYPALAEKSYSDQKDFIMGQCFGTADFYSKNLKKLGCEAAEIIPNNELLQKKWAVENGLKLKWTFFPRIANKIPQIKRLFPGRNDLLIILKEQIKKAKPEVLYMQDLSFCPPSFLLELKKYVKLLVGQIASPLPPVSYLKPYDLILTSFPHYSKRFKDMGINSEYFRIGFEPLILERIGTLGRRYSCTFVGGISPAHKKGTEWIEKLAGSVAMDFFGYGLETLDKSSPILPRHQGEVWGLDMYRALLSSKITINRHIDVAENYANNMRLYEATGCGAMLITEYKDNLNELFKDGSELVVYRSAEELIDRVRYYLEHEKEREAIAKAGQKRTLSEHTYYHRMRELLKIIGEYI